MKSQPSAAPRVLVMGAGGIGGIVTAALAEAGHDVVAVSTNQEIQRAVQQHGMRVRDGGEEQVVPARVVAAPEGQWDYAILATQPPAVEEAARSLLPHLGPASQVVVLQNGLCEERVAAIVGAPRVIGAIVAWGASMPEPGVYERTAAGGFAIGRLDQAGATGAGAAGAGAAGDDDAALRQLAAMLEAVGPVTVTRNLRGARWSKLALNSAISSLGTIAGERLGPVARVRRYRRLALEVMTEAVEVARARGVRLEKVIGTLDLEWVALSAEDRAARASASLTAKHALLLAVGMRYRRMRSSMLSAIERRRPPAIDFLNGEIVRHGAEVGVATPVNRAVVDTVWRIARGEERSSRATLDRLCDELKIG
jgi:2-dehydropantoate 2-reductase